MARAAWIAVGVALCTGCASVLPGIDPDNPKDGEALFSARCAGCHGADARGDGPGNEDLPKLPPDLTRLSARNGGEFPRDYVMSVIFASPGPDSAMPIFGHGDLGDLVIVEEDGIGTPIFTDLLAIATYLETLQAAPPL